jgi:peroxiredoxin family protein
MADIAAVAEKQSVQGDKKVEGLTMVVFSGDLDKALAAFIIANGAAAMDIPVAMFFTFWGINIIRREGPVQLLQKKTFMESMFGWMMPKGPDKLVLSKMNMGGMGTMMMKNEMARKNVYNLPRLIQEARDQGVRMIGCTMSMDIMGFKKEELLQGTELGAVGKFIASSDESRTTLFI